MNPDVMPEAPPSPFDALQMELRGYEVARLTPEGWEQVKAVRPNEYARKEAIRDANWLTWRSKQRGDPQEYKVRPIVSIDVDFTVGQHPELNVPADALVTPDTLFLDADEGFNGIDCTVAEESLIVKPEGDEFAKGGFAVAPEQGAIGNVEIPYNYDQLAGCIDIPPPWEDK